jgi:hypothetical protein
MWHLEDSSIDSLPLSYQMSECLIVFICNPVLQGPNIETWKCCDVANERILSLLVVANIVVGV